MVGISLMLHKGDVLYAGCGRLRQAAFDRVFHKASTQIIYSPFRGNHHVDPYIRGTVFLLPNIFLTQQ